MYRKITEQINFKPVTQEQFDQLTVPLKKMGVTILRSDEIEETKKHLKFYENELKKWRG